MLKAYDYINLLIIIRNNCNDFGAFCDDLGECVAAGSGPLKKFSKLSNDHADHCHLPQEPPLCKAIIPVITCECFC